MTYAVEHFNRGCHVWIVIVLNRNYPALLSADGEINGVIFLFQLFGSDFRTYRRIAAHLYAADGQKSTDVLIKTILRQSVVWNTVS